MKVKIKAQSKNRMRLEVPFRCTAAVQLYLEAVVFRRRKKTISRNYANHLL